jgi:peptide-methionine (S)-S-oxide reductase
MKQTSMNRKPNSRASCMFFSIVLLSLFSLVGCSAQGQAQIKSTSAEKKTVSTTSKPPSGKTEVATLGAGCFWCVEAVYQQLEGVVSVESGYAGGHVVNPTYEEVCGKRTGHAEVCQIRFDPSKLSYEELLEVFWKTHDPTTPNRQGADIGPQYRSVVFYHDDQQRALAEKWKKELNDAKAFPAPIVTEISPYTNFYKAEDYHQDYYRLNPNQGYCRIVVRPKLEKVREVFASKLKKTE